MRNRLQALGVLDRSIAIATDDELSAIVDALSEDHREALEAMVDTEELDIAGIRAAASSGRLDGGLESIAIVLSDACLADCIEQLGDAADSPSTEELTKVLPGVIERHGLAATRIMLASTVAGDAPAATVIRDLLKNDERFRLPAAEMRPVAPVKPVPRADDPERAALRERRRVQREERAARERQRREQSRRDRGRN